MKPYRPKDSRDFFVGYLPPGGAVRRGMLLGGLAAAVGAGAAGWAIARRQGPSGDGLWNQGEARQWRGTLTVDPYPMLRLAQADGTSRSALLCCPDKCGVRAEVEKFAGQSVTVLGSPIRRQGLLMIAAGSHYDWIAADPGAAPLPAASAETPLGPVTIEGELMDSKCWLGAMKPGSGLTHKGCAVLCVRGGMPLMLVTPTGLGRSRALLATDMAGRPFGEEVLPYLADPIRASGQASVSGDGWAQIRIDTGSLRRV